MRIGLGLVTGEASLLAGLGSEADMQRCFCSGILYTLLGLPLAVLFPFVFGLSKGEAVLRFSQVLDFLRKRMR